MHIWYGKFRQVEGNLVTAHREVRMLHDLDVVAAMRLALRGLPMRDCMLRPMLPVSSRISSHLLISISLPCLGVEKSDYRRISI